MTQFNKGMIAGVLVLGLMVPAIHAKKKDKEMKMDPAMEKAMMLGAPGEGHKVLEPLVGTWDAEIKMWMEPGKKPDKSAGKSENSWEFGGRFIKQSYSGEWNGMPFEGVGYTGYDNVREEYVSTWMDNFTTGIMKAYGEYDKKANAIKSEGHYSCPMTNDKEKWYQSEWKIINDNKHMYTSYAKDEKGKKFKAMEITYTRADSN